MTIDDFDLPLTTNSQHNGNGNGHNGQPPRIAPVGFARPFPKTQPQANHNHNAPPTTRSTPQPVAPVAAPPQDDVTAMLDDGGHRATLKQTDIVAFNQSAENSFLRLAWMLIDEAGGAIALSTLLQEASFELNLSEKTIRRYVFKHTARRASLGVHENGELYRKC